MADAANSLGGDVDANIDPSGVLAARSVFVEFGAFAAVSDVSFTLRPGHLLGLIGPNGAGKTTLLRTLAGLQPASAGGVYVMGRRLDPGDRDVLAHVGFTPDTPPFYEQLTVRDYLRFVARGYDLPTHEADERIGFWLDKVWLAEKADNRVRTLSRGMRQRLGIARTLLPDPRAILLDEPAGGLDPAGRVQFRQLLVDLRDQGKALVVSSHILSDMVDYCTHIGIMARGRMVRLGTVAEVAEATLAAGDGGNGRCRYTLSVARPVVGLAESLGRLPGVTNVQADRDRAVFEYASDRESAAALLAAVVRDGVPVAAFAPNAAGLEEAYLRSGIGQVD